VRWAQTSPKTVAVGSEAGLKQALPVVAMQLEAVLKQVEAVVRVGSTQARWRTPAASWPSTRHGS
jgi:hypothetical protein